MFCKVDDYWEPAKKQLLADAKGFMDSLVKFDKDNIPDRIIKKVSNGGSWGGGILFFPRSRPSCLVDTVFRHGTLVGSTNMNGTPTADPRDRTNHQ